METPLEDMPLWFQICAGIGFALVLLLKIGRVIDIIKRYREDRRGKNIKDLRNEPDQLSED